MNFERTHVTVLLVALLVALAGCTGGGDGGTGEATETSADGGEAATDAGSGDDGDAGGDGSDDGDADGSDDSDAGSGGGDGSDDGDSSDGSDAGSGSASGGLSAPLASVADAESYTATFTLVSETVEGTITLDGRIQLAADGTQYTDWTIALSSGQEIVAQQYIPAGEGTVYSRTQFGDGDDPFITSSPVQDGTIPNGLNDPYELAGTDSTSAAGLQWRYDGVVATPDGQRGKYVIDDVGQLASTTAGFDTTLEFRDVEYIVYVDPGTERVTRIVYTAVVFDTESGVEQDLSLDYTYTDVGSTTIDRPAWVDQV